MRVAIVVGIVLALARGAVAEDVATYQVDGESNASGSDPRVAALDEAFSKAVSAALADVLDPGARQTHKAVLDTEFVTHARLWVARFSVIKDATVDGRRQLTVAVRVDRDKMRAKLEQLDIGNTPDPAARTGIVLLRVSDGSRVRASYGATADKELPGIGALASSLRGAGIALKRAPASGPAARAGGDLPLDDDAAEALVGDARAEVGVIAGVSIGAPVPVRGVATTASLVSARVRVIDKSKQLVGQGAAAVAARGTADDVSAINAAIERAVVSAVTDALPPRAALDQAAEFTGDDTPLPEPGVVLIKVSSKTPYTLVASELRYLGGARGISRAALHRVSPSGWVIGVTTSESVEKIASIARKAPSGTSVTVKVVGDVVEMTLGSR